ncbi:substrate-binding periplasmic protein [Sinimarinibacterium flocculans]|uniref:Amino acid ABC transporter substrate-binding protein (PAAT family) n=1 Tax=Sinimarinibacterium flocculans TaxID=985250 RepID=A0A318E6X3_9GAMM|nr:transporter substrate-binding domain-containing protein [Sinimarinibacterium flocculans]PXV64251.1 amino acid ABC transporter substrate-binding protein (PAAT family) [Sinimarinibacterium flocculans]
MRIWSWLTPLVLSLALAACQRESAVEAQTVAAATPPPCKLRVGWDPWEPYQYEGADGSMQGLDVEIIRLIGGDADCELEFIRGNWGELLGRLREGETHVLMAATPTEERRAFAHFSPAYRSESFALYTRAEDADAYAAQGLAELVADERRIAVTDGYYYGEAATQLILGEQTGKAFVSAPIVELNYTRLAGGEVDALLDDPFVAAAVLRRKGLDQRISRHPLQIHSGEVSLMYSQAGVDEAVLKRLDRALMQRKTDGSLAQLIAKYQN